MNAVYNTATSYAWKSDMFRTLDQKKHNITEQTEYKKLELRAIVAKYDRYLNDFEFNEMGDYLLDDGFSIEDKIQTIQTFRILRTKPRQDKPNKLY